MMILLLLPIDGKKSSTKVLFLGCPFGARGLNPMKHGKALPFWKIGVATLKLFAQLNLRPLTF